MQDNFEEYGVRTKAIHAGERPDPTTGASAPNLVMSTTFLADPEANFSVEGLEADAPYFYTRWGNPTVHQLEQKLCALEGAEAAVAFGSGMAAISALFFHLLRSGDHLVISDVTYAAAAEMANDLLPGLGIQITKVDMSDLDAVAAALTPQTKLVYAETPCNPILRLTDIHAVAELAHSVGAVLAVDSTFATPIGTRPLTLGADFVLHSLTKYIGGHGDALGGALLGGASEIEKMRQKVAIRTGGILSPFNAWLIMRGMATLPLRMRAHEENALQVANFLEKHAKIKRVIYPGLPSHPQFALAQRQMKNFSGMLTFQVADGPAMARQLAERLKVFHYAVSLGHHRSLLFYMPTADLQASSFRLPPKQFASLQAYAGEGIFRVSIGIEDAEDLCADLAQALTAD
ncbi:MAG: PLP-dependent aspartate aminotransferase family protein [Chloroflexi bacterium]|nr:PLP-dependent aspartate aminotransferase family protein [Chloroflexota bacterium]